jgi:prepilin-type N-terminal cleavage/methylation domain-containing protein
MVDFMGNGRKMLLMKINFKSLEHKGFTPAPIVKKRQFNAQLVRGFTLAELLVTVGILSIVVTSLMSLFVYSVLLNESNNNLTIAATDAQYVMEQIKGLTYDNIDSYTPPALSNLNAETIPSPTVTEIANGLKEITVNVNWTERGRNRNVSLSTRIARESE